MYAHTSQTRATYKIHEGYGDDGENLTCVNTCTTWTRYTGKNQSHQQWRYGVIYTQARFKAWLKKYNLPVIQAEIDLLPKKVWW